MVPEAYDVQAGPTGALLAIGIAKSLTLSAICALTSMPANHMFLVMRTSTDRCWLALTTRIVIVQHRWKGLGT